MQRIFAQSVGDVLRQTIQECNLTAKLDEQKAIQLWIELMGAEMASLCGRPFVRNGVMKISVRAAALRQELNMNRTMMIRLINEHLGKNVIKEIRFIG